MRIKRNNWKVFIFVIIFIRKNNLFVVHKITQNNNVLDFIFIYSVDFNPMRNDCRTLAPSFLQAKAHKCLQFDMSRSALSRR